MDTAIMVTVFVCMLCSCVWCSSKVVCTPMIDKVPMVDGYHSGEQACSVMGWRNN